MQIRRKKREWYFSGFFHRLRRYGEPCPSSWNHEGNPFQVDGFRYLDDDTFKRFQGWRMDHEKNQAKSIRNPIITFPLLQAYSAKPASSPSPENRATKKESAPFGRLLKQNVPGGGIEPPTRGFSVQSVAFS